MTDNLLARVQAHFEELIALDEAARRNRLAELATTDSALAEELASLMARVDKANRRLDGFGPLIDRDAVARMLEASDELDAPTSVGQFRILERLAAGGMGVVYLAEQDSPRRTVAVKMLHATDASPRSMRRFKREADILAKLHHPCIAQIFDAGSVTLSGEERPYIAMEYIDGLPITAHVEHHELEPDERLKLLVSVCEAVHHVHERGVIHRDLKPDNVLVQLSTPGPRGIPKVLDFGVASVISDNRIDTVHTHTADVIGTLHYMSPEHVGGGNAPIDARSDVYSLGVLIYEVLTGDVPLDLRGCSLPEAAHLIQVSAPEPMPTRFRGDLETVVHTALEKDPRRRYATALELSNDLRRFLASRPIEARPISTIYRLRQLTRRRPGLAIGSAATIVAAILGLAVGKHLATEEHPPKGHDFVTPTFDRDHTQLAVSALARGNSLEAVTELRAIAAGQRSWEHAHLMRATNVVRGPMSVGRGAELIWPAPAMGDDQFATARVLTSDSPMRVLDPWTSESQSLPSEAVGLPAGLSSDQSVVVTRNGTSVKAWRVSGGALLTALDVHRLSSVALSDDGRFLAYVHADTTAFVRHLESGRDIELDPAPSRNAGWHFVVFSPDSQRVVIVRTLAPRQTVLKKIVKTGTGLELRELGRREERGPAVHARWSPDGTRLAVSAERNQLLVLNGHTLETERTFDLPSEFWGGHFHPDGEHVFTAHASELIAHAISGEPSFDSRTLETPIGPFVRCVRISPDGNLAMVLTGDGLLTVQRLRPEHAASLASAAPIRGLTWQDDNTRLALHLDDSVTLWNPRTDTQTSAPLEALIDDSARRRDVENWLEEFSDKPSVFSLSPDGSRIALFRSERVELYATESRALVGEATAHDVTALAFTNDERRLAVGDTQGRVTLFATDTLDSVFEVQAHDAAITQLAFDSNDNVLASADAEGNVRIH